MRGLALCLITALFAGLFLPEMARADPTIPALTGHIVDTAHVLDQATISRLTSDLRDFEQQTTVQIAVATLPDLQGYPIEDWGLALLRGWGIGQKGKNNGVVIVIAPNDHKVRIETGYGSEGPLPDAEASAIIRGNMIPVFRHGDYAGGLETGLRAIEKDLAAEYAGDGTFGHRMTASDMAGALDHTSILLIAGIPFVFMALVITLAIKFRGTTQRFWNASNSNRYGDRDPFWEKGDDTPNDWAWGNSPRSRSRAGSDSSSSASDSFSGGGGGGGASGGW